MTGYIEVRCKGDARALIDINALAGIVTSDGGRVDVTGTPEMPLRLVLRGGATIDCFGEAPWEIMIRIEKVRAIMKAKGYAYKCSFLDRPDPDEDVFANPELSVSPE